MSEPGSVRASFVPRRSSGTRGSARRARATAIVAIAFSCALVAVGTPTANSAARSEAPCKPRPLSPKAASLVRPLLQEFFVLHAAEHDSIGAFARDAQDSLFDEHLDRLFAQKGPAADEAIAALMCFYIGEGPADDIVCEAINRHGTIVPYLKRFRGCPPLTGLEPIAPFFTDVPNLREEVLDRIAAGETDCDFSD
jgi:hypothetical protein